MADISKMTVGSTTYDIKDQTARTDISALSALLSGALVYKGTKANLDAIQSITGAIKGDVYTAADTGLEYAWNGTEWIELGAVNQIIVDTVLNKLSNNPVANSAVAAAIDMLNQLVPPMPSASQNGMVLKVVDGVWAIAADTGSTGLSASVSGETLVIG